MPKIVTRLTRQLASQGNKNAKGMAIALLQKQGTLKKGSASELTPHGEKRNAMSPGERAKDRESRYSGGKHKTSDYKYDKKTNAATLKK